jgi:hypothetical protein
MIELRYSSAVSPLARASLARFFIASDMAKQKRTVARSAKSGRFVLGSDNFAKISAVEGIQHEQAGDAVKLTMLQSHDRDISEDILSGGRAGWPAILSSLKSVLETGNPLVIKMAPPERMLAALKEIGIKTP